MKILALDTATEACSAAVWIDGGIVHRFELVQQQHSSFILSMVQAVLAEAGLALTQLDAVAFGRGPGSFTALRIGAAVTQGLAFGADLPVVPVSSLAALAQAQEAPRVLAAFDARRAQVYWGAYRRNPKGLMELLGEESVLAPGEVPVPEGDGWIGVGSGWDQYVQALLPRLQKHLHEWRPRCYPDARAVAVLGAAGFSAGAAGPAEQALPVYLRDEVAIKPTANKIKGG